MIEGISNILKLAYFSQLKKQCSTQSGFTKKNRPNRMKYMKWQAELNQLSHLIQSEEECENWIMLLEAHKHNYIVQSLIYKCTIDGTIKAHNLFLALIQCRAIPQQVWIPIDKICQLKGARKNQHCCIIHFTVANMACNTQFNPSQWPRSRAEQELGPNFQALFSDSIPLDQKIAILPMLTLLSTKNSAVLWEKLPWLYTFSLKLIQHLKGNMLRILQPSLAATMTLPDPDNFSLQMCLKSVQLAQIEGFVSGKNLFSFAFGLYNIPMVLQLLSLYDGKNEHLRILTSDFIIQLFDCFETYEYDLTQNSRNMERLNWLITKNRLYLLELNNLQFINQYVKVQLQKYKKKQETNTQSTGGEQRRIISNNTQMNTNFNLLLCKSIPYCFSGNRVYDEFEDQTIGDSYRKLMKQRKQTILAHVLAQIYLLKIDFLKILFSLLRDCYHSHNEEPSWCQSSPSFYKLQLYLIDNHLLEFLVDNFNVLETNQNTESMLAYYGVIGYLIRGNPIAYGKFDNILEDASTGSRREEPTKIKKFFDSFPQKMGMTLRTMFILLSDQFQWSENSCQNYPNRKYQSYFITRILHNKRVEWLVLVSEFVSYFHSSNCPQETMHQQDKHEWVTFLLTLYYYFEQCSVPIPQQPSSHKISHIDQLIEKEKFLEKLYPFQRIRYQCCGMDSINIMHGEKLLDMVVVRLDDWQRFYEKSSKNKIMEFNLNYPILKMEKNKLKNKIKGYVKRRIFEDSGMIEYA